MKKKINRKKLVNEISNIPSRIIQGIQVLDAKYLIPLLKKGGGSTVVVNDGGTPTSDIGVETLNIDGIEWGLFWKDFAFSKTNASKLSDFITFQQVQGQYVPNITAYTSYSIDSYNSNLFYEESRTEVEGGKKPPIITYGNVKTDKLNVKFNSFSEKRTSQEILNAHPNTKGLDIQYGIVSANGISGLDEHYCMLYVNKISANYARIIAYVSANTSDRYNIFETVKTDGTWYDWKQIYPTPETTWKTLNERTKYKRCGNMVTIHVDYMSVSGSETSTVLGILPVGYRPVGNTAVDVISRFNEGARTGVPGIFYIDIYGTPGQVSLLTPSVSTTEKYDWTITYITDDSFPTN